MQTFIAVVVPVLNGLLLTAVGMDLTANDFARVRRQSGLLLAGLLVPPAVLPLIALGLVVLFDASPDIATGVLLIAACPIGGISNAYSYLARASTALSVTLTATSCLLAGMTLPAVSYGLGLLVGRPLDFVAPWTMLLAQLTLMLALPVALGMGLRARAPALAARCRPVLRRLSFAGIPMLMGAIILSDPGAFADGLATTVPLTAVFVTLSLCVGWAVAAPFTSDPRDRFTVAAEFGTRNISVAMAIAVSLLGRIEFARVATAYALTEIPMLLGVVTVFRWMQAPKVTGSAGHAWLRRWHQLRDRS